MIYDKIVEYCSKQNISIMTFEKMCGIGNGTVGKWKDNASYPSISSLKKIEATTKIAIKKWFE